jgi:hypothetical protein
MYKMDLLKTHIAEMGVMAVLLDPPFSCDEKLAEEVFGVLKYGAKKHPDTDQTVKKHLAHAVDHWNKSGKDESGFSNRAHAIARILLALERACR